MYPATSLAGGLGHRLLLQTHRLGHDVVGGRPWRNSTMPDVATTSALIERSSIRLGMFARCLASRRPRSEVAPVDAHPGEVFEAVAESRGSPSASSIACWQSDSTRPRSSQLIAASWKMIAARSEAGIGALDGLLEQREGAHRVAGIELIDGGVDAPPHTSSAISGRRELPRQLGQVGGGVGGAPRGRVPRSRIERFRDRGFRSGRRERQMARPLLRVDDQLGETRMDPVPGLAWTPQRRRSTRGADGRSRSVRRRPG